MSADFNKPAASDTKVSVLSVIRDMFASLVKMDGAGANLPVDALRYSSSSDRIEKWNGSSWVAVLNAQTPVGTIAPTVLAAAPTGWALCQGQTVSKTGAYAGLWAAMGSAHLFGADPGGGNFILPDMRTRMPVGKSSETETLTIGQSGGSKAAIVVAHDHGGSVNYVGHSHSASVSDPGHEHSVPEAMVYGSGVAGSVAAGQWAGGGSGYKNAVASAAATGISVSVNGDGSHAHAISSAGSAGTSANLPPYLVLNYIVKL